MELKILDKKDETLLSRTSIKADLTFQGVTPSKEKVQQALASLLKVDENLVVIKKIRTLFGQEKAEVIAYNYESAKALKNIEPKKKEKVEKKGEAAVAETKPAEKEKKEIKKEEAKKEEKKEKPEKGK